MNDLYRVLYCSRTQMPGAAADATDAIHRILAASRRNNARVGITGGLLFSDGCFAQVLEGPIGSVTETFERIQCDERHRDVTVLQAGRIDGRGFPCWSMGFAGTDAAQNPLAGLALAGAFSSHDAQGQDMLDLLKAVIVREDDRLQDA